MIKKFFSPPAFKSEDDNFRTKFINRFAWSVIALLFVAMLPFIVNFPIDVNYTLFVLPGLIVVLSTAVFLFRRRYLNASGLIIVLLGWLGFGIQANTGGGIEDVVIVAFIAIGLLANFSTSSLREALDHASKRDKELEATNKRLQELNLTLEERVASRTGEMEISNQKNEKRVHQFQTVAQMARVTTANQNLETLLPNLVELISKQFGFYHAGIFLLDEEREFAELRAANSEGGKRMLARRHKLGIGQSGIVGYVSATGKSRIALDVEADAAFFNNPDLPNTHSEMALPLRIGEQIIGVLDIQSIVPNAFQEEDVDVLSTLADQVAIAIQNARSFEISQELLSEAQKTSGAFLRESWRVLQTQEESLGYQITDNKLKPLSKPVASAQIKQAMMSKVTVTESGENATLSIPIRLRNTVIGVLDIRVPDEHEWDSDEVDVAEAVAERLSLALEASLLLKSTQRQAEIERITADISTKIGATTQFDSILRTAAEELSRVLGGSEVLVQLQRIEEQAQTEIPSGD